MLAVLWSGAQAQTVGTGSKAFNDAVKVDAYDPTLMPAMLASVFGSATPFGAVVESPSGHLEISGIVVDAAAPAMISGQYLATERHSLQNLIVDDRLLPGVDLNIGYNLDMSGPFSTATAYDGFLLSAGTVNSPYAALTNGGDYLDSTIAVADGLHVRFGEAVLDPQHPQYQGSELSYLAAIEGPQMLYDMRQAQSRLAGVDWDFASWGGLGMIATQTAEENGLLGGFDSGALSVAKSANTSAVGLSAHVGFEGWVTTLSYNEGLTQLALKPNALVSSADTLHSRAYGFAVAKHGLFGDNDSLGLALTRPLQVYSGSMTFTDPDGIAADSGDLKLGRHFISLTSGTPETDVELGYVTTFMDGAVALQANAGYQMNVAGVGGTNALSVVSRAKINF